MNKKYLGRSGFTIVELLVVIVIIGILAVITIVGYVGVTQKATVATLQSDLTSASNSLSVFAANSPNNDYPTAVNCVSPSSTEICLQFSGSNSFSNYTVSNATNPKTFSLDISNGTTVYRVTNDTSPTVVIVMPITAIAATTGVTTSVGSVLTAGALTPGAATATYQWQNATTAGGTYTNISGATASTYTLAISDVGKYLKVIATATGSYSGVQTSAASVVVSDANWLGIGNQVWGKANLNVGTMITGATAQTNNAVLEKYCYGDSAANCTTYGGLYQWNEAMQYIATEGTQGICPAGSHIPSDNEWKILEIQLGMSQAQADGANLWRGTDQGTKLKSGGASGLNIPIAGYRSTDGNYYYVSADTYSWSSSVSGAEGWYRHLSSGMASVDRSTNAKAFGFSVRCLGN